MIAQPSTKKADRRAPVAIATEQPGFVSWTLGGKTLIFLFPLFHSLLAFFLFCQSKPGPAELSCALARLHQRSFTEKQERSVARSSLWHTVHVTLAHAAHCAVDAHRHLQSHLLHLHCRRGCHTITPGSAAKTSSNLDHELCPFVHTHNSGIFFYTTTPPPPYFLDHILFQMQHLLLFYPC